MYLPKRLSTSRFVPIRHLNYHVRTWGEPVPGQAPLVMVHGWMDVGASFQFVVDAFTEAFAQNRWMIAPDWRGYGLTRNEGVDNFWMPDYLADLDFLLDHFAPNTPADLVGHSMGGNVAMHYAGVRPERIRRLINLEGFGMPVTRAEQAPSRYARWMDELKRLHRGEMELSAYANAEGVARRLMKTNPRLGEDKAHWLATHWAAPDAQGKWRILGDPAHKIVNANLSQVAETLALYGRITAPTLSIEATENAISQWYGDKFSLAEYHERLKTVANVRSEVVGDAGHMLHHDQPLAVATLIEGFLA